MNTVFWSAQKQAHGGTRYRLYIDHKETPFFIDAAPNSAHYTMGRKYGLYGSGMGNLIPAQTPYRIAACFGGFNKISDAKSEAIRLASQ